MPRKKRIDRRHTMVIAAKGSQFVQRTALTKHGFHVSLNHSLLDGYTQASSLLSSTSLEHTPAILVDLLSTEPLFPALSGTLLIAGLARRMRLQQLRPAWLIGLVGAPSPEQEVEADIAGCHYIATLPLTDDRILDLRRLTLDPAPIPHQTGDVDTPLHVITAFQNVAHRVIEAVQAAQAWPWTPEDVALILHWLTPYPLPTHMTAQAINNASTQARIELLLRALGGSQGARQRLEAIAGQWQHRYRLHGEILHRFLAGWERREIVRYFVEHGLYEDSRIYFCIKELPRRIAEHLRCT